MVMHENTSGSWRGRSVLLALAIGLVVGGAAGGRVCRSAPRGPIGIPTHVEVWRPDPLGVGITRPVQLDVYRVSDGEHVLEGAGEEIDAKPSWRIVLVTGERRLSVIAAAPR
jgi:hypothetical protein